MAHGYVVPQEVTQFQPRGFSQPSRPPVKATASSAPPPDDELQKPQDDFFVAMPFLQSSRLLLEEFPMPLRNALYFIAGTDMPAPGSIQGDELLLEPRRNGEDKTRITLVLDLDETLVHCRTEPIEGLRHNFTVRFEESQATGWIYIRPFARLFLEIVARLFEVVVFTASSRSYADQVLDVLDPQGKCISRRLYRPHCTEVGGGYLKDMGRLNRPLDRVVLVDNSPVSLAICPDNGVLVSSWTGEQENDRELVDLLLLLQQCMQHQSVPDFLAWRYGLGAFLDELRAWPEILGEM